MTTLRMSETPTVNAAVSFSLEDRIFDLGGIDPLRVRSVPAPGSATIDDLIRAQVEDGRLYELVDNTLVAKAMGWQESLLAMVLGQWMRNFLDTQDVGVVTGPDGNVAIVCRHRSWTRCCFCQLVANARRSIACRSCTRSRS